jgi:hypothetical protein
MYFLDSNCSFESIAMALTDGTTKVLSRMDQEMYESLPEFMKNLRPIAQSNVELLRFSKPSAISHYLSAKADNTVRGKSINFAHLTEFAFYPDQEKKLREVSNALSSTGQLVIETTPNRPGDRYHQMAQRAKDGVDSEYTLFFWPWYKHDLNVRDAHADFVRTPDERALELKYQVSENDPNLKLTDEQLQWRRYQINEYGEALFKKENPGTFEEAFEHLSGQWFSQDSIENIDITWKAEGYRADDCYSAGLDIGGGGGAVAARVAPPPRAPPPLTASAPLGASKASWVGRKKAARGPAPQAPRGAVPAADAAALGPGGAAGARQGPRGGRARRRRAAIRL